MTSMNPWRGSQQTANNATTTTSIFITWMHTYTQLHTPRHAITRIYEQCQLTLHFQLHHNYTQQYTRKCTHTRAVWDLLISGLIMCCTCRFADDNTRIIKLTSKDQPLSLPYIPSSDPDILTTELSAGFRWSRRWELSTDAATLDPFVPRPPNGWEFFCIFLVAHSWRTMTQKSESCFSEKSVSIWLHIWPHICIKFIFGWDFGLRPDVAGVLTTLSRCLTAFRPILVSIRP